MDFTLTGGLSNEIGSQRESEIVSSIHNDPNPEILIDDC